VNLDGELLRAAMFVTAEACRTRALAGRPIPGSLRRLHERLDVAVRVSASGPDDEQDRAASELVEMIDTAEAAVMLGKSTRQVRRIAADLDGKFVAGRWLFSRAAVTEYAEAKRDGRHAGGNGSAPGRDEQ